MRSELTIDIGAIRRNARTVVAALEGAELWAVVKADGYGHGAADVARGAVAGGATGLCTVTVGEALVLRSAFPALRILVMGPAWGSEIERAREARLELVVARDGPLPDGIPVHLKLDTGMGRYGLAELPQPPKQVVGLMSHLATADTDPSFAQLQVERFREATAPYTGYLRHIANSAAALRIPSARFDAARCGIALLGLSPFGTDPAEDGLEPALSWHSELVQMRQLQPGQSTGYGRVFVAEQPTWMGIVPVGYGDGFRRDLTGTSVLVGGEPRPVIGTISMDSFAVELPGQLPVGTEVTLIGPGVTVEEHARVAETIPHDLVCGIRSSPQRGSRVVVDD